MSPVVAMQAPADAMQAPVPARLNKAQVSQFAEEIAGSLNFKPGDDVFRIVRELGGEIEYQDIWNLDDGETGSIVVDAPNHFKITLATHTSKERDRFTIAHELGHYFVHCLLPSSQDKFVPIRATRYGSDLAEWQANWFAAAFLMPGAEFRRAYAQHSGDVYELARHFGVSASAASVRAKSLGLAA
jgi:predicted transcriptional regulator